MKQNKIGLVLEGGGAKGAYALGFLLASRDMGFKFDAVAGTSVGALNAAILSTGKLNFGKTFWSTLSFASVLKPRILLPLWILLPLHLLGMLFSRIGFLPFTTKEAPRSALLQLTAFFGMFLVVAGFVSLLVAIFAHQRPAAPDLSRSDIVNLILASLLTIALPVPFIVRALRWSVFEVAPLARTIEDELAGAAYSIPTYATLDERRYIFDPDRPGLRIADGAVKYLSKATEEERDVPVYVRVDSLEPKERASVLLGSAALPFGIFPPIVIGGVEYIDGGLADNLPAYPLIAFENCDTLIVVRLRPAEEQFVQRHWQNIDRNLRVARTPLHDCERMYRGEMSSRGIEPGEDVWIVPPLNVPIEQFPSSVKQVIVVAPSRPLGNFLSGTMNFSARYAARLMKAGYEDTVRMLTNRSVDLGTFSL